MIRKLTLTFLFLIFAANQFAQSGRVKSSETPKPKATPAARGAYNPTQTAAEISKPAPTPKKTPATKGEVEEETEIESVESNLVPIPVSVLDQQGRAVTDLRLEDFELQIDGKAAQASALVRSDAPVRLALLFDNSSSVSTAREFEKRAAVKFFRRVLRPDKDLAALYSVQSGTRLEQPLTKDTDQLVSAIEGFPVPAGATALLDAIITASEYLKTADGRRVIVIVSDGEDTLSDATFDDAVKAAQVNNCQIYVVKTTDFENFKRTGERRGNANIRALDAERRMQSITQQTGGAVYSPIDEKELDQAFNRISAELSQQYVLSYYPENEREMRGEFRAISLAVKNRQNLSVRTRKGYYVPKRRNQ